ncbi:MAG TPA: S16 family serine protease, partial [Gemmatimonadales bacterium]
KTVLVPAKNASDLVEVPDEVRTLIDIRKVETIDQVLEHALLPAMPPAPAPVPPRARGRAQSRARA